MLIWVYIFLFMIMSGCTYQKHQLPVAINGVLDLTNWKFDQHGPIRLDGEWEFYWKELYAPQDFESTRRREMTGLTQLPNYWSNLTIDGQQLPGTGYATYRLKIL